MTEETINMAKTTVKTSLQGGRAQQGGSEARGLRCMMELVMRDIMFDAPSSSSRRRLTKISADYVKERLGSVVRMKDAV